MEELIAAVLRVLGGMASAGLVGLGLFEALHRHQGDILIGIGLGGSGALLWALVDVFL